MHWLKGRDEGRKARNKLEVHSNCQKCLKQNNENKSDLLEGEFLNLGQSIRKRDDGRGLCIRNRGSL